MEFSLDFPRNFLQFFNEKLNETFDKIPGNGKSAPIFPAKNFFNEEGREKFKLPKN
jgi:hypothetical protein